MPYKKLYIQNTNCFSHLVDRLIIENIKLADFVRRIEVEQLKEKTNTQLVSNLYRGLKLANEARSAIKNELDQFLHEVIKAEQYNILIESRTMTMDNDPKEDLLYRENLSKTFDIEQNKE